MRTKTNRKRNKSYRLPHSSIHRNKRTRRVKITPIRNKSRFILPKIDDETVSSISSNSNNNYNRSSSTRLSSKNPISSSSETSTAILDIPDNNGLARGKTIKHRKGKKSRKGRGKRGQRGGTCYGRGVGANSYDPNFSIYNTRELQLFPYKPT